MKIAIVDDIAQDRKILGNYLKNYMTQKQLSYKLVEFESGESFLDAFHPGIFFIVFLDIYMSGINGLETAKTIYKQDPNCHIIFLTASLEHAQQSYSVHAVYYLVKPIVQEQFWQAMDFCQITPQYQVPSLSVVSGNSTYNIPTEKILYIDYYHRITYIHFFNHTLKISSSFHKITDPLLSDERFLTCTRGVIVNMQHIEKVDDIFFIMDNGDRLQLSIRNKKTLTHTYRHYMFKHMED